MRTALRFSLTVVVAVSSARADPTVSSAPSFPKFETANPAEKEARAVDIVVVAPDDVFFRGLRSVVTARAFSPLTTRWSKLPRFDSALLFQRPDARSSIAVRAFLDLSSGTTARLFFANVVEDRFLVRQLALSPRFDDVDREALGQIVEVSIAALLDDTKAGLSRKEAESALANQRVSPSAPPPATQQATTTSRGSTHDVGEAPSGREASRDESGIEATIFYAARAFSSDVPLVHGPGVALAWAWPGENIAIALRSSAQYQMPQTVQNGQIGAELEAAVLRAGVEASKPLAGTPRKGGGTRAVARLEIGADVTRVTPLPGNVDPSARLASPYASTDFVLAAALGVAIALGKRIELSAGGSIDVDITRARYQLQIGDATTTVLAPRAVRPGVVAGVTFD